MRLLKLGVYHPKYLRDFYTNNPLLGTQQYSEQHAALIDDRFGSSDFWTEALSKLGYVTTDVIANAEILQKSWATENGQQFSEDGWLYEIAAAQITDFRPDVLLVADYTTFDAGFLRKLRSNIPSLRLILGWCGAPYSDSSVFREWDIALSCVPELVAEFSAGGLNSYHINHAFDPRILPQLDQNAKLTMDFAFIGSIVKQQRFHIERERLLLYLIKHTSLQIFSDVRAPRVTENDSSPGLRRLYKIASPREQSIRNRFLNSLFPAKGRRWQANSEQNVDDEIGRRVLPPVFGLEMFQRLRNTKVIFNNHIDISHTSASNMRLFETTGVGSCLLTDSKENLSELFEPETDVLTYGSAEECAEKVTYILDHEAERRVIAAAGQARTLRDHTFDDRARTIDEIIRGALSLGSRC